MTNMAAMRAMRRITGRSATIDLRGPLRVRTPQGLISAADATRRLSALVGCQIADADVSMDRLVVAINTQPMHLVVISGPVVISDTDALAGTQVAVCQLPGSPRAVAIMDVLIGRTITEVGVAPEGGLRVGVECGHIKVDADPTYEAWEVRGMDGGLLACLPGGAISLWTPIAQSELTETS